MTKRAHLRIARPTDNLERIVDMYVGGLGFERLGGFEGHSGFDGAMIGHAGSGYHLEFTHQRGHQVGRAPTQDHLLVFYLEDRNDWESQCGAMEAAGFERVKSYNPYWEQSGATFEDVDGYRVVLQNTKWGSLEVHDR